MQETAGLQKLIEMSCDGVLVTNNLKPIGKWCVIAHAQPVHCFGDWIDDAYYTAFPMP